jgi:hypothetical protein
MTNRHARSKSRRTGGRRALHGWLERLEERRLLATIITVNTTADTSVPGPTLSLRQAIELVNGTLRVSDLTPQEQAQVLGTPGGGDSQTIAFDIPGSGVQTIAVGSPLPALTKPVTIDGYTQPGSRPNTLAAGDNAVILIELNGLGASLGANGLVISGGQSTVRGLAIHGFLGLNDVNLTPDKRGGSDIELSTNGGDVIEGDFLGVGPSGTTTTAEGAAGLYVFSTNNTIGGTTPAARDVISGSQNYGVYVFNASDNVVEGNFIGPDAADTDAISTSAIGVELFGLGNVSEFIFGNTIGGTTAAARNIITGNVTGIQVGNTIDNVIEGNYIGTDATGAELLPDTLITGGKPTGNLEDGIASFGSDTIGGTTSGAGNVISGNGIDGIFDFGGRPTILGNLIGTDATGLKALGNGSHGIGIEAASFVTIGGTAPGSRNVISGNHDDGIGLGSEIPSGLVIQGNYIGTNATGMATLGNGLDGIGGSAIRDMIGGTTAGAGNVISGNGRFGIGLENNPGFAPSGANNLVQGNLIGTDATGKAAVGNGADGINLVDMNQDTIGGTAPGAGNLTSGNLGSGIVLKGSATSGNLVQGNRIGTDATGAPTLGNGQDGVLIMDASGNTIGGADTTAGNRIADNGVGIFVNGTSTANTLLSNSIFSNQNRGIVFAAGTFFPTLTTAVSSGGMTSITGTLTAAPNQDYLLQFFDNAALVPAGAAEGQTLLGATGLTTDSSGLASFTFHFPTAVAPGNFITATTTDPTGTTSEFSSPVTVTAPPVAPEVLSLQRFGFHTQPTSLVLTFSTPLDPATAVDVNNYQLSIIRGVGRGGNLPGLLIRVREALYNPEAQTVTIVPARRLDIHNLYLLTVNGSAAGGIKGASGLLLDGTGNGTPGTNYAAIFSRKTLAGPASSVSGLSKQTDRRHTHRRGQPRD